MSAAVGIAAGLFASFAMNTFQAICAAFDRTESRGGDRPEPATIKVAAAAFRMVSGKAIPQAMRPLAGNAVHYSLGAALGVIYACIAAYVPLITIGAGSIYAVAIWLVLDEGALPALGFGDKWTSVPVGTHCYGLVSHLVFGVSLEGARRLFIAALG